MHWAMSLGWFEPVGDKAELFHNLAAYSELRTFLLGFYATGLVFLNSYLGRVVLPLGAL